jgi:hypothetical protein
MVWTFEAKSVMTKPGSKYDQAVILADGKNDRQITRPPIAIMYRISSWRIRDRNPGRTLPSGLCLLKKPTPPMQIVW